MEEILLFLTAFALLLFLLYREHKHKEKENHEFWISEVRGTLSGIENEFRHKCQEITAKYFEQYIGIIGGYSYHTVPIEKAYRILDRFSGDIQTLKDEYLKELKEKIIARKGKYFVKTVPDHLEAEYIERITRTSDTFFSFISCLEDYLSDVRIAREYGKEPATARKEFEEWSKKQVEEFMQETLNNI